MRVVSLLPSATELLCAIGGESLLVGRSHECDWPPTITDRPVLTGPKIQATTSAAIDREVRETLANHESGQTLYTLDAEPLRSLQPDVILTQDLCDVCSIDLETVRSIASNMNPAPAIVSLNPKVIEDVFDDVLTIGQAVEMFPEAQRCMVELRGRYWQAIDYVNPFLEGPEVAFLEWMDPLFAGGHWTPQLIEASGGRHSLNAPGSTSRPIEPEELLEVMPDRLIICPCGYDLEMIQRELDVLTGTKWWNLLPAVQDGQVALVDGNQMFNRPGPRLVEAFRWLVSWINDRPALSPAGFPWK